MYRRYMMSHSEPNQVVASRLGITYSEQFLWSYRLSTRHSHSVHSLQELSYHRYRRPSSKRYMSLW
jgi:hypothetical protein